MARNLSWPEGILNEVPAVSQICVLIFLSLTLMVFVANYTPMVGRDYRVNSFVLNRDRRLVLPTPESMWVVSIPPIRTSLKRKS